MGKSPGKSSSNKIRSGPSQAIINELESCLLKRNSNFFQALCGLIASLKESLLTEYAFGLFDLFLERPK